MGLFDGKVTKFMLQTITFPLFLHIFVAKSTSLTFDTLRSVSRIISEIR